VTSHFAIGFFTGGTVALCFVASFMVCFCFWKLAQSDRFFTLLKEGHTKAIMSNGKPVRLVMRSEYHRFRHETSGMTGAPEDWDIIPYEPPLPPSPQSNSWMRNGLARLTRGLRLISGVYLFDNLVWVGFPPAYKVHSYSFKWSSRVQDLKGDGMMPKTRGENISHILAPQQDTYFTAVDDAKTADLVPVDASVALTVQITNPFKALFSPEQWLKVALNQMEPDIREVVGRYTYEALVESRKSASNELEADPTFVERREILEKNYGVRIVLAQFRSIKPTGKLADEITNLSLQKYTGEQRVKAAEQEAKAIRILAKATKDRLLQELGTVTGLGPAAVELRRMELMPKGLLVFGGQTPVIPTIPLAPHPAGKTNQ